MNGNLVLFTFGTADIGVRSDLIKSQRDFLPANLAMRSVEHESVNISDLSHPLPLVLIVSAESYHSHRRAFSRTKNADSRHSR